MGKFVTFEGADGVGKSTQCEMLRDYLIDRGAKVELTREPGGSDVAEQIRDLLKKNNEIDVVCEALLIFAARRHHFVNKIRPLLKRGYWVICDRFYDSSLVYQGVLRGFSISNIMLLKQMIMEDFEPDFTIVLDLDFDKSVERMKKRGAPLEFYDSLDRNKYDIVRNAFKNIVDIFSSRAVLVNAGSNPNAIFQKILKAMENCGLLKNL